MSLPPRPLEITLIRSTVPMDPYLYPTQEFERQVRELPDWRVVDAWRSPLTASAVRARRLRKLLALSGFAKISAAPRCSFAMIMDINTIDRHTLPHFLRPSEHKAIYLFDAWPAKRTRVVQTVKSLGIQTLFVSARQSADDLRLMLPGASVHWIPEAIRAADYDHAPWEDRDIDVLQFGRRHEPYHSVLAELARLKRIRYLHSTPGGFLFDSKEAFRDGLARSKICICFPKTVTHPQEARGVSTMTMRYLQAMASKCLILGILPADAQSLFDYQPLVEVDFADPGGQLMRIMDSYQDYLELIERNYEHVIREHQWTNRAVAMSSVLDASLRPAG